MKAPERDSHCHPVKDSATPARQKQSPEDQQPPAHQLLTGTSKASEDSGRAWSSWEMPLKPQPGGRRRGPTEASVPEAWTAAVRISGSLDIEESAIPSSPLKI